MNDEELIGQSNGDAFGPRPHASHHARSGHGHSVSVAIAGRCETCSLLTVSDRPQNVCNALRPANVDFRWDRSEIPMGRFVSEADYLVPCPLYQGPCDAAELQRRAEMASSYIEKHLSPNGKWVNRFELANAPDTPTTEDTQ